jgi:hypothetical protein
MAKFGIISDLHLANHKAHGGPVVAGLNTRCRLALDVLRRAVSRAVELKCEALFILGDVFDTWRPEPQIVAAVQEILSKVPMDVAVLEGNHDMVSMAEGDHSLGPLAPVATVLSAPEVLTVRGHKVFAVPYQPGPAVEWLPRVMQAPDAHGAVALLLHLGISTPDMPSYAKEANDQVPLKLLMELMERLSIPAAFAGNWHQHVVHASRSGRSRAIQVGALVPTGWDNPGVDGYGTLVVYDPTLVGVARWVIEAIPGPRFINLDNYGLSLPTFVDKGWRLFPRVKVGPEKAAQAVAWLEEQRQHGMIAEGEVEVDAAEARAAARTAATVAQDAGTFEEALMGFVQQMPLLVDVDRTQVLLRAREFLTGGSK